MRLPHSDIVYFRITSKDCSWTQYFEKDFQLKLIDPGKKKLRKATGGYGKSSKSVRVLVKALEGLGNETELVYSPVTLGVFKLIKVKQKVSTTQLRNQYASCFLERNGDKALDPEPQLHSQFIKVNPVCRMDPDWVQEFALLTHYHNSGRVPPDSLGRRSIAAHWREDLSDDDEPMESRDEDPVDNISICPNILFGEIGVKDGSSWTYFMWNHSFSYPLLYR
ncbi:hypothetical protein GQR58_023714 [Nymphon striatum]|nr:hypothetical protein GQR58_023714 [Nymphon striatum]